MNLINSIMYKYIVRSNLNCSFQILGIGIGIWYSSVSNRWSSTSSQTMPFPRSHRHLCFHFHNTRMIQHGNKMKQKRRTRCEKNKEKLKKMQGWRDWNCMFQLLLSKIFGAHAKNFEQKLDMRWIETVSSWWFQCHLFGWHLWIRDSNL